MNESGQRVEGSSSVIKKVYNNQEEESKIKSSNNNNKDINSTQEISGEETLTNTFIILDKIFLIFFILFNIFIFFIFGWNHLVLFTVTMTILIRIYLGVKNKNAYYFLKGSTALNMCFLAYMVKIIFRLIMTCVSHNVNNEKDYNFLEYNFFETNHIFWINGFDIKINGFGFIIFFIVFCVVWIFMIIFLRLQKKKFIPYISKNGIDTYSSLIDAYYEEKHKNTAGP